MRAHKSLSGRSVMAAGVAESFMSFEDVVARVDVNKPPKKRGPYKKRAIGAAESTACAGIQREFTRQPM